MISNYDEVIDSRDIIERLEYLQEHENDEDSPLDEDEREELKSMIALMEDSCESPDWAYGETLIRDSYFKDYAKQLAEDIGTFSGDESWPLNCIDWDEAAEQLQQDYFSCDYNGVKYWIRS